MAAGVWVSSDNAVIVVEEPRVQPIVAERTVAGVVAAGQQGPQGEPGPPGQAGENFLTYPAGANIGGHRAVVLNSNEEAIYADYSNLDHAFKVLGITTGAASAGADATIQPFGEIAEPSWNWALDQPVYLGANGQLTQTPPSSGFLLVVGFPISPTKLYVEIGESIFLQ